MVSNRFTDYLDSLTNLGINPSLTAMSVLCRQLRNPQRRFDAVQITGTNGKTSTAKILSAILKNHGFKSGLYISPHLQRYNERWSIEDVDIDSRKLEAVGSQLLEPIEAANRRLSPRRLTQFEVTTGFAFYYFAKEAVDVAVLEVGMGGRWDATSVVVPKVAVVTNVTMDHANYLGNTLMKIAAEKSHVVKRGTKAVVGVVEPKIGDLFKRRAARLSAGIKFLGQDFCIKSMDKDNFSMRGVFADYIGLRLSLLGEHQRLNAAMAIAAAESYLGRRLEMEPLSKALLEVKSPGRLEVVSRRPLVVLDGAHNPAGAAELRKSLPKFFYYKKLILILSMLKDKEVKAVLDELVPLADVVISTTNHNPRALTPEELADRIRLINAAVIKKRSLDKAIAEAKKIAGPKDLICITGSLYGVGEARNLW